MQNNWLAFSSLSVVKTERISAHHRRDNDDAPSDVP